jgi:hypothetical protein
VYRFYTAVEFCNSGENVWLGEGELKIVYSCYSDIYKFSNYLAEIPDFNSSELGIHLVIL